MIIEPPIGDLNRDLTMNRSKAIEDADEKAAKAQTRQPNP
jgi:hypothetical protein